MLTVELVAKALPPNLKGAASQSLVDMINNVVADPILAEQIQDNFISYTAVLKDGKFKTEDYLHAVTYVSHKLTGASNQDAYFKTFPRRYQRLVAAGTASKDIAAYVAAYNRGKLVNLILEQTMVPTWVLNQHLHQAALNVQADLMNNSHSDLVRTQAANSLLVHLAKPKEVGPLINIDLRETSGMNEMKEAMLRMAEQQIQLIQNGVPTKDVAAQRIFEAEDVEVK